MSEIEPNLLTVLDNRSMLPKRSSHEAVDKTDECLVVELLRNCKVPAQLVYIARIADFLSSQPQALNHSVDFGRFQKDHEQLHKVGQEKASLELHLFVDVH